MIDRIGDLYHCLGGIEQFQLAENFEVLQKHQITYIGIGVLTTSIF